MNTYMTEISDSAWEHFAGQLEIDDPEYVTTTYCFSSYFTYFEDFEC